MKRSVLIIPFALVAFVLFSPAVFSSISETYDSTTGDIKFTLNPGWNLVPLGISIYADPEHVNTCKDTIKASYTYSPVQKQYLGSYYPSYGETIPVPENAEQILMDEKNSNFYHAFDILGGTWLYTTQYCQFEAGIPPKSVYGTMTQEDMNKITIKKGWNFIAITPFMIDNNLKDLFQSCDVLAANTWDDLNQKWTYPSSSQYAGIISENDANIYEAGVGRVFVVKFGDDCHLTLGNGISPPPLPE